MRKNYSLLFALGIAAASLSSCSRANYSFNTATPAYLGSGQACATTVATPTAVPVGTTEAASVAQPTATHKAAAAPTQLTAEKGAAQGTIAKVTPKVEPHQLTRVERLILKRVNKQLASKQQNTASVEHTASKTGTSAIIAGVGLLLLLLGAAANVGIIAIIGLIAFIVGLVLVIVHLVNGD